MSSRIEKTPTGGRIVSGETILGDYLVEWDKHKQIVRHELTLREPQKPPPDVQARVDQQARGGGCDGCGQ